MKSLSVIVFEVFAATAMGQVTITPTTICRGNTCTSPGATGGTCAQTTRTVFIPTTETTTSTSTETTTSVLTQIRSITATLVSTETAVRTTTVQNCAPAAANCPTLTSTGTACRTCLVAGCVTTQVVTKSCGCPNALATTTTNFPCNDRDSCNQIGCRTVYSVETQRC